MQEPLEFQKNFLDLVLECRKCITIEGISVCRKTVVVVVMTIQELMEGNYLCMFQILLEI
jgi:hypothetical protein